MTASEEDRLDVRLEPQPASVATARRDVRDLLTRTGREDLLDACVLLVSEIVTNALLHAGTPIGLSVVVAPGGVRVEVRDGSPHLPSRRRYATTSGTGRGLQMLEAMADDWGTVADGSGKTVWFHVSEGELSTRDGGGDPGVGRLGAAAGPTAVGTVPVELREMPLLLHAAWQEHAEALLREYLLAHLEPGGEDAIQVHADATDAIALLEEHLPHSRLTTIPDTVMADAVEPDVSAARVRVPVPVGSVPHFGTLDRTIESALAMARAGQVLTPPTQPEVQAFRRWLCREVLDQADGAQPRPWAVPAEDRAEPVAPEGWDPSGVRTATTGLVAANADSQILAVSPPALRLLGYQDEAELVGRRILAIVPHRLRQAHVAGLTMYLLVGRGPLMGRPVVVPALRRDGSEVEVDLVVRDVPVGQGRSVLVADIGAVAGVDPGRGVEADSGPAPGR